MLRKIAILAGDQTGQELLEETLRLLQPDVIQYELEFDHYDLSLENRRKTDNKVVYDAADAIRKHKIGLKAATITPEDPDDVGSPNALLRDAMSAEIILRTGRRIPGVRPVGGFHAPVSVVRMAVDGAYGATEWREERNGDIVALRTEKISQRVCRAVSEFAFQHARKNGSKVFGGPKYTVSAVYEALLKEEMDLAAARYPDVRYEPQLIDATFALLIRYAGEAMTIPTLNRDGDLLSDLVLQVFGSIAGAESMVISMDENMKIDAIMAEAPHGTAPSLEGLNVANPMAMFMASGSLLSYMDQPEAKTAGRAINEACMEAVYDGVKTGDLGGHSKTDEFTNEVIARVRKKIEVWSVLS
ncbi:MAG: isocitrate dehydrogenase (NAD+) [Cellvibrionaceae bacterium]|jgi:isocitrate dehydrogenase (NAD+)